MYKGYCWYLGEEGVNCDRTCANFNSANEALGASNVIPSGDCSLIDHFNVDLGLNLHGNYVPDNWGFGYMHNSSNYRRYCAAYDSSWKIGTNVGEPNGSSNRRLVCACSSNFL